MTELFDMKCQMSHYKHYILKKEASEGIKVISCIFLSANIELLKYK